MFCIAGFQDGRQKQKHFPPLVTILFFHANTGEKFFIVLSTNMATFLSHGRKLHTHYNGSVRKEDPGNQQAKTNSFMDRDWPMAFIPR